MADSKSRKPPSSPKPKHDDSAPDLSIVGSKVSLHPAGYDKTPIDETPTTESSGLQPAEMESAIIRKEGDADTQQQREHERNLVGGMARFRTRPFDFLQEMAVYVSGAGWRSYDNVVGQPVFYQGFSENMKNAVLARPMLRQKVGELAERRVLIEEQEGLLGSVGPGEAKGDVKGRRRREVEEQVWEVVDKMTEDMICKMESKTFIRGAYYMVTQLLTRAYHQGKC